MKKISLALLFASVFALTACGDASETSDLSAVTIGATSVRIDQNGSRNTCGGSTTLQFGGIDAAGRGTFIVSTKTGIRTPVFPGGTSCDIAPKIIFPGLKLRVKTITYLGSWSTVNGAFGNIEVSSGPRSSFTRVAVQPFSGQNPNFLKTQTYPADSFTNCGDNSLGEILMTRPAARINGGIAGKVPQVFPNLKEIRISLEVTKC